VTPGALMPSPDNLYNINYNGLEMYQPVKVPGTSGSYWAPGLIIPSGNTERPMVAAFGPTP